MKNAFLLTSKLSSESVLGKGWISLNHICKIYIKNDDQINQPKILSVGFRSIEFGKSKSANLSLSLRSEKYIINNLMSQYW